MKLGSSIFLPSGKLPTISPSEAPLVKDIVLQLVFESFGSKSPAICPLSFFLFSFKRDKGL